MLKVVQTKENEIQKLKSVIMSNEYVQSCEIKFNSVLPNSSMVPAAGCSKLHRRLSSVRDKLQLQLIFRLVLKSDTAIQRYCDTGTGTWNWNRNRA